MLQVWNRNTHSGIVGAFNVQGSSWDRRKRQFHMHNHSPPVLSTRITPADVPDWEPMAPTSHMLVSCFGHSLMICPYLLKQDLPHT